MSYADLSSELSGNLPGISAFLADKYINRAWRKIRDAKLWSFLQAEDSVVCPPQLTAGAYRITQFDNVVTANAIASAAFLTLSPVILPPQFLQIRFQGAAQTSQIYSILDVNFTNPAALVFTLDRVVVEASNAASAYLVYRPYVAAPVPDFLRWTSIVDMVNGWALRTDYTSKQFDIRDPQRQALGQAYFVGFFGPSSDAVPVPIYEFWPGPVSGQTFYVRYQRRGLDFSAPVDTQPDMIPDDLIVQCALGFYAYQWAMANPGHFPALKGVNWMNLIGDAKKTYFTMLQDAKRQDDNQATTSVLNRGHGLRPSTQDLPFPIDANFIQSHLLNI